MDVGHLGIEIINAARRWVRARAILRRVLDSKMATPQQIGVAKNNYNRASHEMEVLVTRLERELISTGNMVSPVKRVNTAPLQQLLQILARTGAQALHETLNKKTAGDVIDVEAEVIDKETR